MGRDKHENESLIAWGWDEDVWFHVEDMSSAHVYVRLGPGMGLDDIPEATLEDAAVLVKANSIEGCKKAEVRVVYTMWNNLRKSSDMEVGQVGFHKRKGCRWMKVGKEKAVQKQLMRTKVEKSEVDFRGEKERHERELRRAAKEAEKKAKKEKDAALKAEREMKKGYGGMFDDFEKDIKREEAAGGGGGGGEEEEGDGGVVGDEIAREEELMADFLGMGGGEEDDGFL